MNYTHIKTERLIINNLLIVDDETGITECLSDILEINGKFDHIFTANSGEEALSILQKQHISVIVTDVNMPSMTGPELVDQVVSGNYSFVNNPKKIFYLTGNFKNQENLCQKNVTGLIMKPIENFSDFQDILLA